MTTAPRFFFIPMQAPASGDKGTPHDPWRPRHLREIKGIRKWHCIRTRTHALVVIEDADDASFAELLGKTDVAELTPDAAAKLHRQIIEAQGNGNKK